MEFSRQPCGCRRRLRALSSLRSAAAYEGPLERAVHRFKYEGWRSLAPALAGLLADRLALEGPPAGVLLAVPLHHRRARERGYNQAQLLARELGRRFALGFPGGQLVRIRDTQSQVGLDRVQRRSNVAQAFAWQGPPLRGEPVMLVDDVATTGATLEACAVALRQAGAGAVTGLTVARVQA